MRHHLILTAAFVMTSCLPAVAEQSQAYFTQGLQICMDFGTDGFFVKDRLEEQAVACRRGQGLRNHGPLYPGWHCLESSLPKKALQCLRPVLLSQKPSPSCRRKGPSDMWSRNPVQSISCCPIKVVRNMIFFGSSRIRIWSNGQDDFCNNPDNARVEVIALEDPTVGM